MSQDRRSMACGRSAHTREGPDPGGRRPARAWERAGLGGSQTGPGLASALAEMGPAAVANPALELGVQVLGKQVTGSSLKPSNPLGPLLPSLACTLLSSLHPIPDVVGHRGNAGWQCSRAPHSCWHICSPLPTAALLCGHSRASD